MFVNVNQRFVSRQSPAKIKVTAVKRSSTDTKFDRCTVAQIGPDGRIIPSTRRQVYADSIRRRYWKL